LGAALFVLIATAMFGGVHGKEFCPRTFERRSYSYYEIPLVGIQVTGEQHDDLTGDTEKAVVANKFIPAPTSPKQDWHVLVGSRSTKLRRPGDAGLLMQYLDAEDADKNHRWLKWSNDHAELAKVFWPAVQQLALHKLYLFMPDLFDLAKTNDDPTKLKKELDLAVAQKLRELSQRLKDRGDDTGAASVLKEADGLATENVETTPAKAEKEP
jgi:hypothetical protein